ncbi:hypothetical protein RJ641_036638 [Dillenia turbinata]|uniref:Uncharacterized protein n=1 Tax=Dillenia turbinata TaxID=194707 RepID=A0AAN8VHM0_9MAGN
MQDFKTDLHFQSSAIDHMLELKKIHTDKNTADMLMKVIPGEKFEFCSNLAGLSTMTKVMSKSQN